MGKTVIRGKIATPFISSTNKIPANIKVQYRWVVPSGECYKTIICELDRLGIFPAILTSFRRFVTFRYTNCIALA